MGDQYRRSNVGCSYVQKTKMENEFSPKKTMIILVIVVGCFAVLWPKIFYPMLVNSADHHLQPSAIDKTTGCCYVLSETDVDTIKIMSELCWNIIKEQMGDIPLTGKQVINICQDEVLKTCGIDISAVLQEQVRLGRTTKQILDQIRSLNGSLCLKYSFGVQPWRLGVPHIVTLRNVTYNLRQERPAHVKSEMVHPAFRERGRAIPQAVPQSRPPKRIIEGRPGPIPGMRPTMGGAGHVVSPSKQGTGSMGVIMPIYTVGIVIFFTYTLMKIIFKKHPDTDTIYSTMEQEARYKREVFGENGSRGSRDSGSCKLGDVELDQLRRRLQETEQAMERVVAQMAKVPLKSQDVHGTNTGLSNGGIKEKPSVKVMSMDTTESCEGGKKWQSANSSVLPSTPSVAVTENVSPQEIYLDKVLPPQSQILVADSAIETEQNSGDDPAVILAGKMTLSVISLENENLEIDQTSPTTVADFLNNDDLEPAVEKVISEIIDEAVENLQNDRKLQENLSQNTPNVTQLDSNNDENQHVLNLQATSSEESVDTVLSAIIQEPLTKEINDNEVRMDKSDASEEEESEVEYEESEEEIEVSEDEEIAMHLDGNCQQEIAARMNSNGNAVLINGASSHNDSNEEASDDEEIIEEIVEEYSEDESEPEGEVHESIHLSSNGNTGD